ncbi:hypothetical protein K402DRAFT_411230 [Aulographum hederae CBS 113979]|uniref:F-box domain-containing protein n=1 Tax=Aulographum hederae CBS 113979 TaxID=1176131 RepID=A0A6G1H807_9PEZI|nr:hypothetical protein K402DRAFT_411230 [Aulographum hederae CBS 113979]
MTQVSDVEFLQSTVKTLRLKDNTLDEVLPVSTPSDQHRPLPATDLGALDVLPLELLHIVLSKADLYTLTTFKFINRRALAVVESSQQYKTILYHARDALRSALRIGAGGQLTLQELFDTLCKPNCELCGDFGGYIYLLACQRVCFLCFSEDRRYLPLRRCDVKRKFALKHPLVKTLPSMRSLTGIYSPNEKKVTISQTLIDYQVAYQAGLSFHGSATAVGRQLEEEHNQYMRGVKRLRKADEPFDGLSGNPLRFMAITRAPVFNRNTQQAEWGAYCLGCQDYKGRRTRSLCWRRRYTASSLTDHLVQYGRIECGEHSADDKHESYFRLLVDGKHIKYLVIDQGLYDVEDMCFEPALLSMIPPLPPEITNIWHPLQMDHLEFRMVKDLRSSVCEATAPNFPSSIVLKFARFDWEIPQLEHETLAYKWIAEHAIGPKFLGHLTEEGRVIGFMIEKIRGFKHAEPGDLAVCQAALERLHRLGTKHGDVNKHNILVRSDGEGATLIDFDVAQFCEDDVVLAEEYQSLERELCDTSGRGGILTESVIP